MKYYKLWTNYCRLVQFIKWMNVGWFNTVSLLCIKFIEISRGILIITVLHRWIFSFLLSFQIQKGHFSCRNSLDVYLTNWIIKMIFHIVFDSTRKICFELSIKLNGSTFRWKYRPKNHFHGPSTISLISEEKKNWKIQARSPRIE